MFTQLFVWFLGGFVLFKFFGCCFFFSSNSFSFGTKLIFFFFLKVEENDTFLPNTDVDTENDVNSEVV